VSREYHGHDTVVTVGLHTPRGGDGISDAGAQLRLIARTGAADLPDGMVTITVEDPLSRC
jgi:hypothetical protein